MLIAESNPSAHPSVTQSRLSSAGHFCACSASIVPFAVERSSPTPATADHKKASHEAPQTAEQPTEAPAELDHPPSNEQRQERLAEGIDAVLKAMSGQLSAALMSHSDIWEARLYHRIDYSNERGGESGVAEALEKALVRADFPAGRVVAIPVLAAGRMPDTNAELHLEALAYRR